MIDFDILIKYFDGKATPDEALQIEEWTKASSENQTYFTSLHQTWLEAGNEIYHAPEVQQEWAEFQTKNNITNNEPFVPKKTNWLQRVAAAAAIVLVAFGGYYMFNTDNQNEKTEMFVAENKAESITLKDGTIATLQPNSQLVIPIKFKEDLRAVTLVGNGSFEVAHNAAQPFVIHLGETHVKVLGTSFDISRSTSTINVKVKTGKVAFYNKADTIEIAAGQTGSYAKAEKKFELVPSVGSFQFNNTPMDKVVAELNAHFKVNIALKNKDLSKCSVTAGFDNQPLEYILKAITETFNLKYEIDNSKIYIDGKACN